MLDMIRMETTDVGFTSSTAPTTTSTPRKKRVTRYSANSSQITPPLTPEFIIQQQEQNRHVSNNLRAPIPLSNNDRRHQFTISPRNQKRRYSRHSLNSTLIPPLHHHHHPIQQEPDQNRRTSELESLRAQNRQLKKKLSQSLTQIEQIQLSQHDLIENFQLLKQKYNDMKSEMYDLLWNTLPSLSPQKYRVLPPVQQIYETRDKIGDYAINELLGEGQFANVKRCTHLPSGKDYAVKILEKNKVTSVSGLKRIRREINVLSTVRHANIVQLVRVVHSPTCVYVLTELGGVDLFDYFESGALLKDRQKSSSSSSSSSSSRSLLGEKAGQRLDYDVAREIVLGIARPIDYLHSLGICHRDLKPENVLLMLKDRDGGTGGRITSDCIQICDFGQCASLNDSEDDDNDCGGDDDDNDGSGAAPAAAAGTGRRKSFTHSSSLSELCGSPGFFAPEMLLGDGPYDGFKTDVWSIGCIMLELTRGHDEFCKTWMTSYDLVVLQGDDAFQSSLQRNIAGLETLFLEETGDRDDMMTTEEEEEERLTKANFIGKLLVMDPEERMTSREMLDHPWLKNYLADKCGDEKCINVTNSEMHAKSCVVNDDTSLSICPNNDFNTMSSLPNHVTHDHDKMTITAPTTQDISDFNTSAIGNDELLLTTNDISTSKETSSSSEEKTNIISKKPHKRLKFVESIQTLSTTNITTSSTTIQPSSRNEQIPIGNQIRLPPIGTSSATTTTTMTTKTFDSTAPLLSEQPSSSFCKGTSSAVVTTETKEATASLEAAAAANGEKMNVCGAGG